MKKIATSLLGALCVLAACSEVDSITLVPVTTDLIDSQIRVVRHDVIVPVNLSVSEANQYLPRADIVWREDPFGDRHAQVKAILDRGLDWGLSAFDSGNPVAVTLEVEKFHALSERARYTIGGIHTMRFQLIVWDANTGVPIHGPVDINADLVALGGSDALQADAEGRTQKSRIIQHIAGVIQQELVAAGLARIPTGDIDG